MNCSTTGSVRGAETLPAIQGKIANQHARAQSIAIPINQFRKTMSPIEAILETRIFKSITEVSPAAWDAIRGPDTHISSHAFIRAVEESSINDCDFDYPVIYQNGEIVAHTCVYSITTDLAVFSKGAAHTIIATIRKVFPGFLAIKLVECGSPVQVGNMITISDKCADKNAALRLLCDAVERIAARKRIKLLLIRDYYEHNRLFFDQLKNWGYHEVPNLPDTFMEIHWSTFDDYVKSMRSRYRNRLKSRYRIIKPRNVTWESVIGFGEYAEVFARQCKNIFDNAREYAREILPPAFYENLSQYVGERAQVIVFREKGRIVAHGLMMFEDTAVRSMYVGKEFDDSATDLYAIILLEQAKLAIERGYKLFKVGITSYTFKSEMGAKLIPVHMYMKHREAWFPWLIPWVFTKMTVVPKMDKRVFNFEPEIEGEHER